MDNQRGQAMVEGLIVLLCLLTFFSGITWLGRLQDIALYEQHASRFGAFELARATNLHNAKLPARFFHGKHAAWRNRQGRALVDKESVHVTHNQQARLDARSQPGGTEGNAINLRKEWRLHDSGIANVALAIRPAIAARKTKAQQFSSPAAQALGFTEKLALSLRRHTAILIDAGHATDSHSAHKRAASTDSAWQQVAQASYAAGKKVAAAASAVDAPWRRDDPVFDWFMPWVGKKP